MIELRKTDKKKLQICCSRFSNREQQAILKLLGLARYIGKPRRLLKPEKNQLRMGE